MRIIQTLLKIVIIGNTSFLTNTNPFNKTVTQNRETILQCRLPTHRSNGVNVHWFSKNDGWLTSGTNVLQHNKLLKVNKPAPNEWNLFIKEAQLSFEDTYTCKTDGHEIISYNLIIETPPKIIESESSPKQLFVKEGGTVEMICVVTGNPIPEVTWYRGDSETPIGISGHMLRIRDVTRYATDKYMCRATSRIRNAERRFRLTVHYAPEAEVKDSVLYVNKSEFIEMSCVVQGSPLLDAYWKDQKGNRMNMTKKYYVRHEDAGDVIPAKFLTVVFSKIMLGPQDYGNYTCVAAGNGDMARAYVELKG